MIVNVREKNIEEIKEKLRSINTDLNKIGYMESAVREPGFSFEIKRFLWGNLSELYQRRKMLERAAKAMANKAGVEITIKDKVESYLVAGELYARLGKIEDADEMFTRAGRDASFEIKEKVRLARKNIYRVCAKELEKSGKRAGTIRYYERLIKMDLENIEKEEIKRKLLSTYQSLGMFREAKLLEKV